MPQKTNLSWTRRKEELQRLRAEAQELETRVLLLQLWGAHNAALGAGMGLSEGQLRWKKAAETEKQRYQAARDENLHMKDKLKRCVRASNNLQTVIYTASDMQRKDLTAKTLAARALQAELKSSQHWNASVVNLLESRLVERLQELDTLVGEARVSNTSPDVDHVRVHRTDVEGTSATLEFKRICLVPFDTEQTSRAVWKLMSLGVIPDDRHARVAKHQDDMFLSQGCASHSFDCGGSVELRASCLMKPVVIPGGFVVFVESTTEWHARPSRSKAWRHVTRDSGWALVLPSGASPGTCRVETSMRLQTSDPAVEAGAIQPNAPTLLTPIISDVVVPSFREIFCSRFQLLENALLDSATATASV